MGTLIADIFVTVKPTLERLALTSKSVRSLIANTDPTQYRLTVCLDGAIPGVPIDGKHNEQIMALPFFSRLQYDASYILHSTENEGLGPTINRAIAHIKSVNDWYSHPTHGDPSKVAPLVVMCQDDLLYSDGWLSTLASRFFAYERVKNIGFASGVECIEHPIRETLAKDLVTKDWIRASQMMGRREYWESPMPIPRFDPETGQVRARPNDGMGSGVDWWLIRNHERSICKTGRTCLVVPGLVVHAGYDKSTWLKRELPESDADKLAVTERK
jgi:hypothetical protein